MIFIHAIVNFFRCGWCVLFNSYVCTVSIQSAFVPYIKLWSAMRYSAIAAIVLALMMSCLKVFTYSFSCTTYPQGCPPSLCGYLPWKIIPTAPQHWGFGDPDAPLHVLELCAGAHRITDVALEYGLCALAMDVPQLYIEWGHKKNVFPLTGKKNMVEERIEKCLEHPLILKPPFKGRSL